MTSSREKIYEVPSTILSEPETAETKSSCVETSLVEELLEAHNFVHKIHLPDHRLQFIEGETSRRGKLFCKNTGCSVRQYLWDNRNTLNTVIPTCGTLAQFFFAVSSFCLLDFIMRVLQVFNACIPIVS